MDSLTLKSSDFCPCGSGKHYGTCHETRKALAPWDMLYEESIAQGLSFDAASAMRDILHWVWNVGCRGGENLVAILAAGALKALGYEPRLSIGECVTNFIADAYQHSWVNLNGKIIDIVPDKKKDPNLESFPPVVMDRDMFFGAFPQAVYGVECDGLNDDAQLIHDNTPMYFMEAFVYRFGDDNDSGSVLDFLKHVFHDDDFSMDVLQAINELEWVHDTSATWDALAAFIADQRAEEFNGMPWAITCNSKKTGEEKVVLQDPDVDESLLMLGLPLQVLKGAFQGMMPKP